MKFGKSIVTDGLVLHIDAANKKSYPGSGTTITDLSGNANKGTLTNGPTFSSAKHGSIAFDGTNDQIIFPDSPELNFGATDSFSVETTYNPLSSGNGGKLCVKGVIGYTGHGGVHSKYTLEYSSEADGIKVVGYLGDGTTHIAVPSWYSSSYLQLYNTWNHAVMTVNRTTQIATLYINGVSRGTSDISTMGEINNSYPLTLGGESNNVTVLPFYGKMNIARIHNKSLTSAEVVQNFNFHKNRN